jgi:hypothetical protein
MRTPIVRRRIEHSKPDLDPFGGSADTRYIGPAKGLRPLISRAEPLGWLDQHLLARFARLARYAVAQRVQNSRFGPHNGPAASFRILSRTVSKTWFANSPESKFIRNG